MNRFLRHLAVVSLGGLFSIGLAQANESVNQSPQQLASASYPNRPGSSSDNGAIRRANPNSRQGTQSISPPVRGPNLAPTQQRPPTLENGGIGNGYPTRQTSPRPSSGPDRPGN